MNTKFITLAAAAIVGAVALSTTASAGTTGGAQGFQNADLVIKVGHKHRKRFKRFRRHKRHFHGHWNYGYGFNNHGYGFHGCGYFYRKAKWTGSRYWWRKYNRCVRYY